MAQVIYVLDTNVLSDRINGVQIIEQKLNVAIHSGRPDVFMPGGSL